MPWSAAKSKRASWAGGRRAPGPGTSPQQWPAAAGVRSLSARMPEQPTRSRGGWAFGISSTASSSLRRCSTWSSTKENRWESSNPPGTMAPRQQNLCPGDPPRSCVGARFTRLRFPSRSARGRRRSFAWGSMQALCWLQRFRRRGAPFWSASFSLLLESRDSRRRSSIEPGRRRESLPPGGYPSSRTRGSRRRGWPPQALWLPASRTRCAAPSTRSASPRRGSSGGVRTTTIAGSSRNGSAPRSRDWRKYSRAFSTWRAPRAGPASGRRFALCSARLPPSSRLRPQQGA